MAAYNQSRRIPVQVHAFRNPSSIWATEDIWDDMSPERRELMELEAKIASEVKKRELVSCRELEQMVAVQCLEDQRKWIRGQIKQELQLSGGQKYIVLLIDRGNSVRVKADRIRNLPFKCDHLPPQAKNIVLDGVVPVEVNVSSTIDAMNTEVSLSWTARAERFVDQIKSQYTRAWFVESPNSPANNQIFRGDLLIEIDNKIESLSNLLCQNAHAKFSSDVFEQRLKKECIVNMKGREIISSPAILWDGSSSSCSASPVPITTKSESSDTSRPRTIGEALGQKHKLSPKPIITESPDKPEESPGTPLQTNNSATPQSKHTRLGLLLTKLKSATDSKDVCPTEAPVLKQVNSSSLSSLENKSTQNPAISGHVEIPLPAVPRSLDDRFIPAGKSITNEKKMILEKSSSAKRSYKGNNSNIDYSSDSSFSDWKNETLKHSVNRESLNSAGNSCGSSSDVSVLPTCLSDVIIRPESSSDVSIQPDSSSDASIQPTKRTNRLSLMLMKLRNTPSEERNEVKSPPTENNQVQQIMSTPFSARDRILGAAKVDDSTKVEDYLARSILLHGGFPPSPWMSYEQLKGKFSAHIEQLLIDRRWCYSILSLEKYMWPAIQQRQNVIMISPPKTGKTFSYIIPLMDFMIEAEHIPRGNGPLVLILCPGSNSAVTVYENCVKVVNGAKKAPRVQIVYGEDISTSTLYKLMNGCEVLVTTPPCLLRIFSNKKSSESYAINFRRLCHYVLDEADTLMKKFLNEIKEIQSILVAEQETRTDEKDPIQIIVSSEKWEPHFPSYSRHLRGNPLLCINDCFEACVYGKLEVAFHLTQSKPTKLLKVLKKIVGLNKVVVFCKLEEMSTLEEFLKNECIDTLVTRPNDTLQQLNATLMQWSYSKDGQHYTLLCTDYEFGELKIQDAMCVVNYSFPSEDKALFVKRLSSILKNLPNIFEEKTQMRSPSIQLILDESNTDQLPVIVQLMHRISEHIPNNIIELAEAVKKEKEKVQKINRTLCLNLKMFGECSKTKCPSRHVFLPHLDLTEDLPGDGLVKVLVSKVRNAGHLSVRLLEHITPDGKKIKWPSQYTLISTMMYNYFSKPQNRKLIDTEKVAIRDIYAMETILDLFQRVEVVEVLEKDKHGNPSFVQVKFLEEGELKNVKVHCLYALPQELRVIPPQCVDVFLCGLLPGDFDDNYGIKATTCVKQILKFFEDSSDDIFVQGKVVLSMTGSLWLDPVGLCEWLSNTNAKVVHNNIKQTLLDQGYAVANSSHLPKLFALCGKQLPEPCVQVPNVSKPLPKPDWAFLERENFEDVQFICAENVEGATVFYVQRMKFKDLLIDLTDDLNKDSSKRTTDEVLPLCAGEICLAKYEEKWQRAQVLSINENTVTVFYVDYGDQGTVSQEEIKSIPMWAITKLPFQAIECSLAGISSVNCDLLYEITDDGEKVLFAKVCDYRTAKTTGGKHYLVALIDPVNQSILNKDLLELKDVEGCEDELQHLDFTIDSLHDRNELDADLSQDEELDFDPKDLEFQEEDLCTVPDYLEEEDEDVELLDGFEIVGLDKILPNNPLLEKKQNLSEMVNKSLPQEPSNFSVKEKENNDNSTERQVSDDKLSDWSDHESEWIGKHRLPVLCNARPPKTKWIEDLYYVWIKICITGVEKYFLHWTLNTIQFSTTVGGRNYLIDQKLRGTIFPGSVISSVKGFTVEIKMKKALSGVDWGKPFASKRRLPWVTRDIESTADVSSDSDCDISLGTLNKEIRKIPLKMRKKRIPKEVKGSAIKPDLDLSSEGSNCEQIDSDEMF